jgi:hypothetical protein
MRRQDRQIVNGALIVGGATALIDILLQRMGYKDKGVDFTWNSYKGMRTIKHSHIGAAVGKSRFGVVIDDFQQTTRYAS